jgi:hypothetical protein
LNGGRTQCNQQQVTRKHTNSTMQIIERKCEAQRAAGIRSKLNFYVVLWTVGKKLDKLTDQPGNLIPLDVAEVLMKTSTLLMHLYQYKYQFLVPLLALVLVNSTIR